MAGYFLFERHRQIDNDWWWLFLYIKAMELLAHFTVLKMKICWLLRQNEPAILNATPPTGFSLRFFTSYSSLRPNSPVSRRALHTPNTISAISHARAKYSTFIFMRFDRITKMIIDDTAITTPSIFSFWSFHFGPLSLLSSPARHANYHICNTMPLFHTSRISQYIIFSFMSTYIYWLAFIFIH